MKLVIFDLDGTLLNTISDLGHCANHVLEQHGLPVHTIEEYRLMVGRGMRNLMISALPEGTPQDRVSELLEEFLAWYQDHLDVDTVPYPGIVELINELSDSGYKLAVASNKIQPGAEKLIRKFFPQIPFVAVMGNCKEFPLKPDAALVNYIMERAGVSKFHTVIVGDSGIDIETGYNADIISIAVSWGFRPRHELENADYIADSADQLRNILKRLS